MIGQKYSKEQKCQDFLFFLKSNGQAECQPVRWCKNASMSRIFLFQRSLVADNFTFDQIDNILGDVSGMVGDPLQIARNV